MGSNEFPADAREEGEHTAPRDTGVQFVSVAELGESKAPACVFSDLPRTRVLGLLSAHSYAGVGIVALGSSVLDVCARNGPALAHHPLSMVSQIKSFPLCLSLCLSFSLFLSAGVTTRC